MYKDYKKVNPEFGMIDDFKQLVESCHEKGMSVVLDWVANHTSWDNSWVTEHYEWYTQDSAGLIISPAGTGWNDVLISDSDILMYEKSDKKEVFLISVNVRKRKVSVVLLDLWKRSEAIDVYGDEFTKLDNEMSLNPFEYKIIKRSL